MRTNYNKEIDRLLYPHLVNLIKIGSAYIALIESEVDCYDVEIEVNSGTIIAVYSDDLPLEEARNFANALEIILKENKIKVFRTRVGWENFCENNLN